MILKKYVRLSFIVLFIAIVSIYYTDRAVILFFDQQWFKQNYWQFFRTATDIGLGENYFAIVMVVYLMTKFILPKIKTFQNQLIKIDFYKRWSINFFTSLLSSGVILQLAKHIIGRQRPLETVNFDPLAFSPLNLSHYFHSMPSGHAQVIFCAATLFSVAFPRLKWFWFLFALFIASTRIATQQHWLSDTIVGAYIGWSGSMLTLLLLTKTRFGIEKMRG